MTCWLCSPLQNKTNTKWERSLFVSNPVLVLITKQDTIFCHRTQEKAILKSVLEFRWLNERCLSCFRWLGVSTEVAGAAHCEEPPVTILVQARVPAWQQSGAGATRRNVLADFTDYIFLISLLYRKHLLQWWPCIVAQPFGQQWIQNPAYVTDRRPSDAAGADSFWGCYVPTGMTQQWWLWLSPPESGMQLTLHFI